VISDDGSVRYTLRRVEDPERPSGTPGAEESETTPAAPEPGATRDSGAPEPADDDSTRATPPDRSGQAGAEAERRTTPGRATTGGATTGTQDIRAQIERDREVLRRIVSEQNGLPIEERRSPELAEIAERLPRLQSELEALEAEPSP